MCGRGSKGAKGGFYRESLKEPEKGTGEARLDAVVIRRQLLEVLRKRPGEVHVLLQMNRMAQQAEAAERRAGKSPEAVAARALEIFDGLRKQLAPPFAKARKEKEKGEQATFYEPVEPQPS